MRHQLMRHIFVGNAILQVAENNNITFLSYKFSGNWFTDTASKAQ